MKCQICKTDTDNIDPISTPEIFPVCVPCIDAKVKENAEKKEAVKAAKEYKMPKTIYNRIYDKLQPIMDFLGDADAATLCSKGFMDLHVDKLYTNDDGIRISLAHNYIQNGDVMADPDMEIMVYPDREMAEAMTFQQDGALAIYQVVYDSVHGQKMVNMKLKRQLNTFLNQWLGNIKKQGFFN